MNWNFFFRLFTLFRWFKFTDQAPAPDATGSVYKIVKTKVLNKFHFCIKSAK